MGRREDQRFVLTILHLCKQFYRAYPQILQSLPEEFQVSNSQLHRILPSATAESITVPPTPVRLLFNRLSFTISLVSPFLLGIKYLIISNIVQKRKRRRITYYLNCNSFFKFLKFACIAFDIVFKAINKPLELPIVKNQRSKLHLKLNFILLNRGFQNNGDVLINQM